MIDFWESISESIALTLHGKKLFDLLKSVSWLLELLRWSNSNRSLANWRLSLRGLNLWSLSNRGLAKNWIGLNVFLFLWSLDHKSIVHCIWYNNWWNVLINNLLWFLNYNLSRFLLRLDLSFLIGFLDLLKNCFLVWFLTLSNLLIVLLIDLNVLIKTIFEKFEEVCIHHIGQSNEDILKEDHAASKSNSNTKFVLIRNSESFKRFVLLFNLSLNVIKDV